MVHAMKTWRNYLISNYYYIFNHHRSLKYNFTQKELNLGQRRWLELIKDYVWNVQYHLGKANVLADALSHKTHINAINTEGMTPELCEQFKNLGLDSPERIFGNTGSEAHFDRKNQRNSEI